MLLTIIHFGSLSILVAGKSTQIGNKSRDTFSPKKVKVHVCFGNTKNTNFFKDVNVVYCVELKVGYRTENRFRTSKSVSCKRNPSLDFFM